MREAQDLFQAGEVGMGWETWKSSARDPEEGMALWVGIVKDYLAEATFSFLQRIDIIRLNFSVLK